MAEDFEAQIKQKGKTREEIRIETRELKRTDETDGTYNPFNLVRPAVLERLETKFISQKEVLAVFAETQRHSAERLRQHKQQLHSPEFLEALTVVGSIYELIGRLRPKFWVVENPKGRLRWFLGKPNSTISLSNYGTKYKKPTDLWHNFPLPLIEAEKPFEPSWSSTRNQGKGSTGLLRLRDPAKRAMLPYGLGETIRRQITENLEHG